MEKKSLLAVSFECFEADVTPIKQEQHLAGLLSAFRARPGQDRLGSKRKKAALWEAAPSILFFQKHLQIYIYS